MKLLRTPTEEEIASQSSSSCSRRLFMQPCAQANRYTYSPYTGYYSHRRDYDRDDYDSDDE